MVIRYTGGPLRWTTDHERLPMPELLKALGLEQHAKKSAKCPFHEDRNPSFSIFQTPRGWRFKCHAGCGEGDEVEFLQIYRRLGKREAFELHEQLSLGFASGRAGDPSKASSPTAEQSGFRLPEDFCEGELRDWKWLANLRNLSVGAVELAVRLGTVGFGRVCDFPCWILTDERRCCAEARRICGSPFPGYGGLGERKAHTLRGSIKRWPLGIALRDPELFESAERIVWVEGGPDYLSALHFRLEQKINVIPVAMLGATTRIEAEALPVFKGRRIRVFAHHDANGQGREAAQKWGEQLLAAGAHVDGWSFEGLRKADGSPVKDLNDCTRIHPEHLLEFEEAWR